MLLKNCINIRLSFSAGIMLSSPGSVTQLDACRMTPFVNLPTVRDPLDRLPFPPFLPYFPLTSASGFPPPLHPMLLYHHHYAAAALNYASLPDSGFKATKTTSIADLRLKARQHLASLGLHNIWRHYGCIAFDIGALTELWIIDTCMSGTIWHVRLQHNGGKLTCLMLLILVRSLAITM